MKITYIKSVNYVLICVIVLGSSGRYDSYEAGGRTEYKSKCMAGG